MKKRTKEYPLIGPDALLDCILTVPQAFQLISRCVVQTNDGEELMDSHTFDFNVMN